MATGPEVETIVWRAGPAGRTFLYGLVVIGGVVFGGIAIGVGEPIAVVALAVAWAMLALLVWARGLRLRLTLTAQAVEIRDYPNDATIPLRDIAYCQARPAGMQISRVDGRINYAPYPTKSLIAHWTGRRTGADAAAELIMARAEAARNDVSQQVSQEEWWPFTDA